MTEDSTPEQGARVAHPCANYCALGGAHPVLRKGEQYHTREQPTPETETTEEEHNPREPRGSNPLCPRGAMYTRGR